MSISSSDSSPQFGGAGGSKPKNTDNENEVENTTVLPVCLSSNSKSCANCKEIHLASDIVTELHIINFCGQMETLEIIAMKEVIRYVFGAKSDDSQLNVEGNAGLCQQCANILAQMYNLHSEFWKRSNDKTNFHRVFRIRNETNFVPHQPDMIPKLSIKNTPVTRSQNSNSTVVTSSNNTNQPEFDNGFESSSRKKRWGSKFKSVCPQCGKEFNTRIKNALENHIKFVHENIIRFSCPICGRPFQSKSNLESHQTTHLGKMERTAAAAIRNENPDVSSHLCSECGLTFKSTGSLYTHLRRHANPARYQCNNCDSNYCDASSLRKHVQLMHIDINYLPIKCKNCEERFKTSGQLREHVLFCTKENRPHKCILCHKRFKLKQHLELHLIRMHQVSKDEARETVYPYLPKKSSAC